MKDERRHGDSLDKSTQTSSRPAHEQANHNRQATRPATDVTINNEEKKVRLRTFSSSLIRQILSGNEKSVLELFGSH
ncbi:hypothetical protein [Propionimicrobium lymphophilum]|uniref:hypothetical protein n=1 Tax=Propionimicrobium lymphophilum TaxID=33012 RepID=UPI0023F28FC5|nr:hypothetical protein [Propionimicrobium lymphophilum]